MLADKATLIGRELQLELSSTDHALYFHGTSMEPFLREGDLVVVRPISWNALRPGDIVTYRHEDKFPTRRVLRKHDCRLSLRCDGWPGFRGQTTPRDVLGRADARCRDGQWIRRSHPAWRRATLVAMAPALARAAALKLAHLLRLQP